MKKILCFLLFISIPIFSRALSPDSQYLERQVDFWKYIFTELSIEETIIHNRTEPSIIYSIVDHKGMNHTQRKRATFKELRRVRKLLKSIQRKRYRNLNSQEQEIIKNISKQDRKYVSWKEVRYQQGMREGFRVGLKLSRNHINKIKKIFNEVGIPEDIAYLPHVESSFNYKAYSRVGAAGMWQFMPKSAKMYDLEINEVIDERLHPIKSTHAAARLLRDNYKILDAWPLAITAYNYGPGGLYHASKKLGSTDITKLIEAYKTERFSFASRNFYVSFLAAKDIAKNYQTYFPDLKLEFDQEISEITLDQDMLISDFLKSHFPKGYSFRDYNPFVKRSSIKKDLVLKKGLVLYVPKIYNPNLTAAYLGLGVKLTMTLFLMVIGFLAWRERGPLLAKQLESRFRQWGQSLQMLLSK